MPVSREDVKRLKKIFRSNSYGLRILSKIYYGNRPSQIAELLRMSAQHVNYYTSILIRLGLIEKTGDRRGISWKVTDRGLFVLKRFIMPGATRNGNNCFNNANGHKFPIRLHNVCFSFPITSSLEYSKIRWTEMSNGVSRHTMVRKQPREYSVHLIKSPYQGNSSMLIHMNKVFTFSPHQEIIRQYEAARAAAVQAAQELRIEILSTGKLVTRPHLAFAPDLIALHLATIGTASINNDHDTWIDASHGIGELETDDPEYVYKYLIMPEKVYENSNQLDIMSKKLIGYRRHYDPLITDNN